MRIMFDETYGEYFDDDDDDIVIKKLVKFLNVLNIRFAEHETARQDVHHQHLKEESVFAVCNSCHIDNYKYRYAYISI